MKKNFVLATLVLLVAVASCSFTNTNFENNDKDKLLIDLITYVLERGHYEPKSINDNFSAGVYDGFIDILDPTKRYFLASDLREFEKYKYQIDDEIKNTEITFFNLVHNRLEERMEEAKEIYAEILKTPFDYSAKEEINIDYKKADFARNKKELKERWRLQLKYNALGVYNTRVTNFENESDEVLTASKKAEFELEARESTLNTLNEFFDFVDDLDRQDWFVQYVNTIVEEFDPHTFYFAPEDKEKFDMSMSGKFEGIGCAIAEEARWSKNCRDHLRRTGLEGQVTGGWRRDYPGRTGWGRAD